MTCAEGAIKKQRQKAKREALSPVASATPGNSQFTISRKSLLPAGVMRFVLSSPTKQFCGEFLQRWGSYQGVPCVVDIALCSGKAAWRVLITDQVEINTVSISLIVYEIPFLNR